MKSILSLLLIISIITVCLTGCWGQSELNELAFVLATGIDLDNNKTFQVTVIAAVPTSGQMQAQTTSTNMWIGVGKGDSISAAVKDLVRIATKRLTWIQNNILIFGEDAARRGLDTLLDYFVRSRDVRYDNYVLVAEGTAEQILTAPSDVEKNLYQELNGLIKNADESSKAYTPDLMKFMINYSSESLSCIAGRVRVYKTKRNTFSAAREIEGQLHLTDGDLDVVELEGSAVFRGNNLVGFMYGEETRGFQWIIGEVKKGTYEHAGQVGEGNAAMEVISSKTDIRYGVENGELVFKVKCEALGRVTEQNDDINFMKVNQLKKMEDSFSDTIKKEMESALKKAQKEYKTDIFGFGDTLYRKAPDIWKEVKADWDIIFSEVKVMLDVKVDLHRTGEAMESIKLKGRE